MHWANRGMHWNWKYFLCVVVMHDVGLDSRATAQFVCSAIQLCSSTSPLVNSNHNDGSCCKKTLIHIYSWRIFDTRQSIDFIERLEFPLFPFVSLSSSWTSTTIYLYSLIVSNIPKNLLFFLQHCIEQFETLEILPVKWTMLVRSEAEEVKEQEDADGVEGILVEM